MSKSSTFANDMLLLWFNAIAITNLANNATSAPLTDLFVSLHTADPGEGGNQSTSEISYTGYAREPVVRNSGGWTVTGSSVAPAADIVFGQMTAGAGGTVTHAAVGVAVSGASKILYRGTVTPNIAVGVGVEPRLTASNTSISED